MKKNINYNVTFALVLCFFSYNLFAQDNNNESVKNITTDRPNQTEAATLVPKRTVQLETGFLLEENHSIKNITYNTALFRYGVNSNFELRLVTDYLGTKVEEDASGETKMNGFGPLKLGTKIKVAEAKGLVPTIAFLGHITLRTGASEYMPNSINPDFRFLFEYGLGQNFSLGFNLGAQWQDDERATGLYTCSLGYSPVDRLSLFAELYGFLPEQSSDNQHLFDTGFTYMLNSQVQIDFAGGFGLSSAAPDHFLSAGVSVRAPH